MTRLRWTCAAVISAQGIYSGDAEGYLLHDTKPVIITGKQPDLKVMYHFRKSMSPCGRFHVPDNETRRIR